MRSRYLLIVEIIWIITGLLCIAAGIRFAVSNGGSRTLIFAIMAVISFVFAVLRHNQRKKN